MIDDVAIKIEYGFVNLNAPIPFFARPIESQGYSVFLNFNKNVLRLESSTTFLNDFFNDQTNEKSSTLYFNDAEIINFTTTTSIVSNAQFPIVYNRCIFRNVIFGTTNYALSFYSCIIHTNDEFLFFNRFSMTSAPLKMKNCICLFGGTLDLTAMPPPNNYDIKNCVFVNITGFSSLHSSNIQNPSAGVLSQMFSRFYLRNGDIRINNANILPWSQFANLGDKWDTQNFMNRVPIVPTGLQPQLQPLDPIQTFDISWAEWTAPVCGCRNMLDTSFSYGDLKDPNDWTIKLTEHREASV